MNESMLNPRPSPSLSCLRTPTEEVTYESISKMITDYLELPVSYVLGSQIPFQDSHR